MRPIQYLLIAAVLFGAGPYFWLLRTRGRDRILAVVIGCLALLFIILPELTSQLATAVGVGRGTDLTTYAAIVAVGLALVVVQSRLRELQRQLTAVVRRQAVEQALPPQQEREAASEQCSSAAPVDPSGSPAAGGLSAPA